jgi:hypothetical protein
MVLVKTKQLTSLAVSDYWKMSEKFQNDKAIILE